MSTTPGPGAPRRQRRRGFSLIEALIAGAIFATGVAGILSATASYMGVIEHDRKLGEAWRLLQAQAARMRGLPDSAPEWNSPTNITLDRLGNSGGIYTLTTTVSPDTPFPPVRQVALRISWVERTGTRSTSLVIHR